MVWRTQTCPMQRNQKTLQPSKTTDMFCGGCRPHDVLGAFGIEGDLQ